MLSPNWIIGRDYLADVALGLVPDTSTVAILGHNDDVDGEEDVWAGGGLYPWMTAATSLEIVSTSANDTLAGTGMRTIQINGLDINYNDVVQTVNMNGLTPVPLPTQLYRINSVTVLSSGSGKVNAGVVSIRDAGGGTVRGVMRLGKGRLSQAIYTVKAGYQLLITSSDHSIVRPTSVRDAAVAFYIYNPATNSYLLTFEICVDGQPVHVPIQPINIPEKSDIGFRCTSVSATNTELTSALFGILKKTAPN